MAYSTGVSSATSQIGLPACIMARMAETRSVVASGLMRTPVFSVKGLSNSMSITWASPPPDPA